MNFGISARARLLNVRQGPAWALAKGFKTVENRKSHLPRWALDRIDRFGHVWVLVVASKAKITAESVCHLVERLPVERAGDDFRLPPQSIVAAIRIVDSKPADQVLSCWSSKNPNEAAWIVDAMVEFTSPIQSVAGCQTPLRKLSSHPDAQRICAELARRLPLDQLDEMFGISIE